MFQRLFSRTAWCCKQFHQLYDDRYERSLFVFVHEPLPRVWPRYSFWLAFRSVTYADLQQLPTRIAPDDVPVTISTSRRIDYCPWCGRNLLRFYRNRCAQLFDRAIATEFSFPEGEASGISLL